MSETNNKAGKVVGKLFFGLSLIILAAVLALSVYLSGQGKLISKTLTLYKSGSIDKIEPLLSAELDKAAFLADLERSRTQLLTLYGDDLSVKYDFQSRDILSTDEFIYNCTVTAYGGDNDATENFYSFILVRENGKWKIAGAQTDFVIAE